MSETRVQRSKINDRTCCCGCRPGAALIVVCVRGAELQEGGGAIVEGAKRPFASALLVGNEGRMKVEGGVGRGDLLMSKME